MSESAVLAPMTPEMQFRLRGLGASSEQVVRLNELMKQRNIDFEALCAVLARESSGYLGNLLAVFDPPPTPGRRS